MTSQVLARRVTACPVLAGLGSAPLIMAWPGQSWLGTAWHGEATQ
jgi:hypothetical protein